MSKQSYAELAKQNKAKAEAVLGFPLPEWVDAGAGRIVSIAWARLPDLENAAELLSQRVQADKQAVARLLHPDLAAVAAALGVHRWDAQIAVGYLRRDLQRRAVRRERDHAAIVNLMQAARARGLDGPTAYVTTAASAVDVVIKDAAA